ncbi:MAG: AmmeMemoRadiSam system radical SAM enzyme [Thermoplasmatales archaeon]|nr:AmmeMemoRadiSam system radical SAM enzyme [Thermoplasmatales archaeon]
MKKEASFWNKIEDKKVQCNLCSHNCKIDESRTGVCGVRRNDEGKLYTLIYGSCSSMAADPIEKKPLYHFHPGTNAFSMGTVGCNFKCSHCQNNSISTADPQYSHVRELTPEEVVKLAEQYDCQGVSYTYNEPTIWHEFCYDSAKLVKKAGLYTCYVTNGYINEDPLRELSLVLDAMNIDVKAFNDDFYKKVCKARLKPVLDTCELAKELGIHIELTYLVIPTCNDSFDEIRKFCGWIVEKLGSSTPVHFTRFHPDHNMMDIPATPMDTLLKIYDISKEAGVLFPYVGNVAHGDYENTVCPKCGHVCIERVGFSLNLSGLTDFNCKNCGNVIPIITDNYKKQKI